MKLQDQIVLITGGGRNLGKRMALRLADEGAQIAVLAPEEDEVRQTVAELHARQCPSMACVADVSQEAQVIEAVADVRRTLGPITVLVNNAGIIGPTALVRDVDRREWDETIAVNLTGAMLCTKAVVAEMIERRAGKIINISSVAGRYAYPLRSPYAASKWGLVGLTLSWAKELGPYNIRVNAVCPGPVEGPRMEAVIRDRAAQLGRTEDEIRDEYLGKSPLHRMVTADDVAEMVAYLASPAGDNITGQALEVSAGYGI